MFEYFNGKFTELTPTYVVVDCGGVGYLLHISLQTYEQLRGKDSGRVFSHQSIKEDAHTLFGFHDEKERKLFRLLISVSGVGAGTARMMLSSLSAVEIEQAIQSGNSGLLQSIKGIGTKTAQRIVIDLRDKVLKGSESPVNIFAGTNNTVKDEALSALVTLGFAKNTAEKALDQILKGKGEEGVTIEKLIKTALQSI